MSVTIYTRVFCGYCVAAKKLLERKGISYVEHDASHSRDLRAEMTSRANGRSTFPQIFIGNRHIGGSDELFALERAGKLDTLLSETARA